MILYDRKVAAGLSRRLNGVEKSEGVDVDGFLDGRNVRTCSLREQVFASWVQPGQRAESLPPPKSTQVTSRDRGSRTRPTFSKNTTRVGTAFLGIRSRRVAQAEKLLKSLVEQSRLQSLPYDHSFPPNMRWYAQSWHLIIHLLPPNSQRF